MSPRIIKFKNLGDSEVHSSDFPGLKNLSSLIDLSGLCNLTGLNSLQSPISPKNTLSWWCDHHWHHNKQYWSFWCHWWSNQWDQEVFWENKAVEAVEANEVAEAAEVNEAAVISKAWKITIEDFRVILVLEFNNLRTKIF